MSPDKRLKAPPELRHITRVEGKKSHAWRVLYVKGLASPIQTYFTDAAYGGKDAALAEAIRFRDQVLKLHHPPAPPPGTRARRNLRFKEKGEPFVGISLSKQIRQNGSVAYAWQAKAVEDGRHVHRSWSIRAHGYTRGFLNASRFRHELTGQPLCMVPPPPPDELLQWARSNGISLD